MCLLALHDLVGYSKNTKNTLIKAAACKCFTQIKIYKADSLCVCVSVCVFAIHVCISCVIGVKLAVVAGGTGSQVLTGVDVAHLTVCSELSFYFHFFFRGRPPF